jgi:hypothetical protein
LPGYLSEIFETGSSVQNIKVRITHNILKICALHNLVIRRDSCVLVNFPKKVTIIIKKIIIIQNYETLTSFLCGNVNFAEEH